MSYSQLANLDGETTAIDLLGNTQLLANKSSIWQSDVFRMSLDAIYRISHKIWFSLSGREDNSQDSFHC